MVFVLNGAGDDVEVALPADVEEPAEPTSSVCVAEEVDVVPDAFDLEIDKNVEFDVRLEAGLE